MLEAKECERQERVIRIDLGLEIHLLSLWMKAGIKECSSLGGWVEGAWRRAILSQVTYKEEGISWTTAGSQVKFVVKGLSGIELRGSLETSLCRVEGGSRGGKEKDAYIPVRDRGSRGGGEHREQKDELS